MQMLQENCTYDFAANALWDLVLGFMTNVIKFHVQNTNKIINFSNQSNFT